MKLLLDNNLSPKLVSLLTDAGHDVTHVRDHGMASADDSSVLALATETSRVLVSADTDFGTLLARTHATSPSFVLVRRVVGRRVPELAAVIADNLLMVEDDLEAGAVVVLGNESLRIRRLPIP
jgi:predicted nuclease of predicted toxin-antitoxin system